MTTLRPVKDADRRRPDAGDRRLPRFSGPGVGDRLVTVLDGSGPEHNRVVDLDEARRRRRRTTLVVVPDPGFPDGA